ncbi:MAG: leucine-rich repeat domain-containing protein [Bacteroidales bacterium]|nr:leucine-rich repeat domain-containing protein [Bacteroidales bacterium]MDY6001816.1 leucine-rich repeat domain-containing protein [Candidatus Cryptobacteroides sp.]
MKTKNWNQMILAALSAAIIAAGACSEKGGPGEDGGPRPESLRITVDGIEVGDTLSLYDDEEKTAVISWTPAEATATGWEANVTSGKSRVLFEKAGENAVRVIPRKTGEAEATIAVTFRTRGGFMPLTRKVVVSVLNSETDYPEPEGIAVAYDGRSVADTLFAREGLAAPLAVSLVPEGARAQAVTLEVADPAVASLSGEGDGMTLAGRAFGKTTLKARVTYLKKKTRKGTETGEIAAEIPVMTLLDVPAVTRAWITLGGKETGEIVLRQNDTLFLGAGYEPDGAVVRAVGFEPASGGAFSVTANGMLCGRGQGAGSVTLVLACAGERGGTDTVRAAASVRVEGVRDASERIAFADSVIKRICVGRWDLDGDGELSVREASLVKTLGRPFNPTYDEATGCSASEYSIKSFDEMQYFVSLDTIPDYTFSYCEKLESVVIPASVRYIGRHAFLNASGLSVNGSKETGKMVLWDNLEHLGGSAFSTPDYVTEVVFGKNLKYLGNTAINDGGSVRKITFAGMTPPRSWNITSKGWKDSLYGPVYENYRITILVPSAALEKYDKKFLYFDERGYSNEEPEEDEIVEYTYNEKDDGVYPILGPKDTYVIVKNVDGKEIPLFSFSLFQRYGIPKRVSEGCYREWYMKEDVVTSNMGRNPYYDFVGY